MDEVAHLFAGRLMQVGSLLREIVYATMHIGIDIEILVPHGIKHHERLLGRGCIVKIHQRFLVNLAPQNGEILPDFIDIVHP